MQARGNATKERNKRVQKAVRWKKWRGAGERRIKGYGRAWKREDGRELEEDGHERAERAKEKERAQGATGAQSPTWVLSLRCCSDGRRVKKTTMTTTRTTSRLPCNGEAADTRSIHQVHSPQDEHSGAKRSIGVYTVWLLLSLTSLRRILLPYVKREQRTTLREIRRQWSRWR